MSAPVPGTEDSNIQHLNTGKHPTWPLPTSSQNHFPMYHDFFWGKVISVSSTAVFNDAIKFNPKRGLCPGEQRVSNENVFLINHRFSQRMVTTRNGASTPIILATTSSIYHVYILSNPPTIQKLSIP